MVRPQRDWQQQGALMIPVAGGPRAGGSFNRVPEQNQNHKSGAASMETLLSSHPQSSSSASHWQHPVGKGAWKLL